MSSSKISIGISSCLLGAAVRYDGGHKKNPELIDWLAPLFNLVPLCPEMAIGLGVPREPIRLVVSKNDALPSAIGVQHADRDVTERLEMLAREIGNYSTPSATQSGGTARLNGYIFKTKSPSCGLEQVKVFNRAGALLHDNGRGVYARTLMSVLPSLPVEDEQRLADPLLRENFIQRVQAYHRHISGAA